MKDDGFFGYVGCGDDVWDVLLIWGVVDYCYSSVILMVYVCCFWWIEVLDDWGFVVWIE